MTKLKQCPICGCLPYMAKEPMWSTTSSGTTHGYVGSYKYEIQCSELKCLMSFNPIVKSTVYATSDEAQELARTSWNERCNEVEKLIEDNAWNRG